MFLKMKITFRNREKLEKGYCIISNYIYCEKARQNFILKSDKCLLYNKCPLIQAGKIECPKNLESNAAQK